MILTVVTLILGCGLLVCLGLLFNQNKKKQNEQEAQSIFNSIQSRIDNLQNQLRINLDGNTQLIEQKVSNLTSQIEERLGKNSDQSSESSRQINERLDNAAKFFADLQNKLGKLDEAGQKIFEVGKDISSLNDILKRPKARGTLGEFFLTELMAEMLPRDRYDVQYRYKNGEQVDAIIRIGDKILPVDSKFPLENFRRLGEVSDVERDAVKKQFSTDVKKHIDAIARKYIQPQEGTFDFAFMFIPSETVFYEVLLRDENAGAVESLQEYGQRKKIIPVSPNSFYAYMGALMYALRGERMQKNIHETIAQIRALTIELGRLAEDFRKLGTHLNNARGSYEEVEKRLSRYQDRLDKIQALESGEEPRIKLIQ